MKQLLCGDVGVFRLWAVLLCKMVQQFIEELGPHIVSISDRRGEHLQLFLFAADNEHGLI